MKKKIWIILPAICVFFMGTCNTESDNLGPDDTDNGYDAAQSWARDDRAINALLKLKNGETVTFAAIGGSITQQGCVDGVRDWLRAKATECGFNASQNIKYFNAGIGASDSGLGLLRLQDHVLRYNPDIIVVEYSVNDGYYYKAETNNRTYEGLVRQALEKSGRAVFLLLMHTDVQGANNSNPTHESQTAIGNNYRLPVFRWMDYEVSVTDWLHSGLYYDDTHPNEAGNASVSKGINDYLQEIWENLPQTPKQFRTALPPAKYSDDYQHTNFIGWGSAGVMRGGWTQLASNLMLPSIWNPLSFDLAGITGFEANSADSELKILFTGKSVYIISTYGDGTGNASGTSAAGAYGQAWVEKDDGSLTEAKKVGSLSSWGGYEWFGTHIADGLDPDPDKIHTLHVKGPANGKINIWGAIVGKN
jgi:lysophospholipase L1-like esterase